MMKAGLCVVEGAAFIGSHTCSSRVDAEVLELAFTGVCIHVCIYTYIHIQYIVMAVRDSKGEAREPQING